MHTPVPFHSLCKNWMHQKKLRLNGTAPNKQILLRSVEIFLGSKYEHYVSSYRVQQWRREDLWYTDILRTEFQGVFWSQKHFNNNDTKQEHGWFQMHSEKNAQKPQKTFLCTAEYTLDNLRGSRNSFKIDETKAILNEKQRHFISPGSKWKKLKRWCFGKKFFWTYLCAAT